MTDLIDLQRAYYSGKYPKITTKEIAVMLADMKGLIDDLTSEVEKLKGRMPD